MFCRKCGNQMKDDVLFCPHCGTKVMSAVTSAESTSNAEEPIAAEQPVSEPQGEPVKPITEDVRQSGNDMADFQRYVDDYVRNTTKYSSAIELLSAKIPAKYIWKYIIIMVAAVLIGFILGGSGGSLLLALLWLLVCPIIGYFEFTLKIVKVGKVGYFSGEINEKELLGFLNGHLRDLTPYYGHWGYLNKKRLLRALSKSRRTYEVYVTDEMEKGLYEDGPCIGTEFEGNGKFFAYIGIFRNENSSTLEQGDMRFECSIIKGLVNGFNAYFSIFGYTYGVRAVPVLYATMEYYLKTKGILVKTGK